MEFTVLPLLQESAVSALAALCNEYYINEKGEADPALQGNDSLMFMVVAENIGLWYSDL